ncbi:MAG: ParB N-terminal domain-containing protein, partial [Anaerolineales bacterium]|nr:ParB N-terminal domain-containing protein [Anaerolineales bacterium]
MKVIQMHVEHLKLWEENPRRNDHAVDAVAKSIKAFGFNVPILCDNEFRIVAGHTRWKAAKSIGMTSVPVIILDLTENQQKAFAIADNKTAEIADWDWPQLREIVEELERTDLDLDSLGFSSNELCQLLNDGLVDDAIPDMEEKSSIERGDLFQLGQHRLICGDS